MQATATEKKTRLWFGPVCSYSFCVECIFFLVELYSIQQLSELSMYASIEDRVFHPVGDILTHPKEMLLGMLPLEQCGTQSSC